MTAPVYLGDEVSAAGYRLAGAIVRTRVSAKDCTFCMACAGVCPMGALSGGQGLPCLRFVEALCVQCGLCAEVCPEQAITLAPHLLFDP